MEEVKDRLWNRQYVKMLTGNFLIHFAFTLIVPLLPLYLSQTYGANKETIGLCLAGYTVMSLIIRPFSGYMVDSFPRKTVLVISSFLFFSVFIGYLAAGSLAMFTIFRTLHGAPFGATSVAINTVAIDVLPSSRRTEGIGYYGLSTNLSTAIGPALAIYILKWADGNFQVLFWLSLIISFIGIVNSATVKLPAKDFVPQKKMISLDRFFLVKGWKEAIGMVMLACTYGILSTYVAIYGKEELNIGSGTGAFFTLFAIGLIISRLTGARSLRANKISRNAMWGNVVGILGYLLFASCHNPFGYYAAAFIIGLGNGHMYPAFQNMFVNLAEHNQRGTANSSILTSWDAGTGLGILLGGTLAENFGYGTAFWCALAIEIIGTIYCQAVIVPHFEKNKLR